jgi:hypothetical protein
MDIVIPVVAGILVLLSAACAATPPPTQQLLTTQSAVRAADELGAEQDPRAALHLKLAQEQLAYAKQLIQKGQNARAQIFLERADADAELAIALTRRTVARAAAERAREEVLALRAELAD